MFQSQQQVTPNILCFSGALLSLRGLRSAGCAWRMAIELVRRMDMARVAMDVAGTQHASVKVTVESQFGGAPRRNSWENL
jgi:HSP20 family molecular chaperone IbpA